MKSSKKLFVLVLSLCLLVALTLAGCGGGSSGKPAEQPKAAPEAPKSPAANYPAKPIQVVVPAAPGGDTDIYVRLVGKYIEKHLGKNLVVVNTTGGGGSTGSKKVFDAAPDGYTALFFHAGLMINQVTGITTYGHKDFEQGPIVVEDFNHSFVVRTDSPYKSLKEIAAYIKENPGKLNFGTELGSFTYLQGVAFEQVTGGKFNMVDAGTASQKNVALEGKQVDLIPQPIGIMKSFVDAGKFRVLAISAPERSPYFKDTPTFKDEGVNLVIGRPYYFTFPKGTPKEIVEKFTAAVKKVTEDPDYIKDMEAYSLKPAFSAPEQAKAVMDKHYNQYKEIKAKDDAAKKK